MYVPKGNILIEDEALSRSDVSVMIENLTADEFTGMVKLALDNSNVYLFYDEGRISTPIEIDTATNVMSLQLYDRIMKRTKLEEISTSSYVTSRRIVRVLSGVFAFQPLYIDYEVKKRDMKKVLENLEADKSTGLLKVTTHEGTHYLVVDQGELVRDRFCREYGEMLCGVQVVEQLLEYVYTNGATISVYAEKDEEIANRRQTKEDELEKIKTFTVKAEGGFLRAADVIRIDDYLIREWGIDPRSTFNVEAEAPDGNVCVYKCQSGRKMDFYAGMPQQIMKTLGVVEGDEISIRPV